MGACHDLGLQIFDFANIILAVIVTIFAFFEIKEVFYQKRINNFKITNNSLASDFPKVCIKTKEFYKKKYFYSYDDIVVRYLIYRKNWIYKKGCILRNTNEIELVSDTTQRNYDKIKKCFRGKNILPIKTNTLEQNMAIFLDSQMYDHPSFAFSDCEISKEKLRLHIKLGTYFDFVNTCLCFGYETAHSITTGRKSVFNKNSTENFKLRKSFDIMNYNNRFALIGVVTLVVFLNVKDENKNFENYFLLHKRSDKVAESQNLLNAVPSGSFQPAYVIDELLSFEDVLQQESITNTVIREFGEELLSIEEFAELSSNIALTSNPLWSLLNNNIYFLGMGFNPLNPYLEMLTIVAIDMRQKNASDLFGGDSKAALSDKIKPNFEGDVTLRKFNKITLQHFSHMYMSAPALKEIIAIILDDFDNILEKISNGSFKHL